MRPTVVWEVAPNVGYSTVWILSALKDNDNGAHLYSFDLVDRHAIDSYLSDCCADLDLESWHYIKGDFQETVELLANHSLMIPAPDYFYVDADHDPSFAVFYTEYVLSILAKPTAVSIHDVFRWAGHWPGSEDHLMPEGEIVVQWMKGRVASKRICGIFTVSNKYSPGVWESVHSILAHVLPAGVLPIHGDPSNPTLYFKLNCEIAGAVVSQ